MKVKWLGHASFLISSDTGIKIITDPYPQGSGLSYTTVKETADIVTISHDHFDHNCVSSLPGKPEVITDSGNKQVKDLQFKGVATYHDESLGKERGVNTVFCFSVDGIKLCHLGDLGHKLDKTQIDEIGDVDILFIPIGGFYTIDLKTADMVIDSLKPKVAIPMHCKTTKCNWPLNTIEEFLVDKKNVSNVKSSEIEFQPDNLPLTTTIVVLEPA